MTATPPIGYGLFLESLIEGRVCMGVDPMMCMLVDSGYMPNVNTHKFKSIVTHEISGSGYISGGKVVTMADGVYNGSTKSLKIIGGNLAWPGAYWNGARYGVLYMAPDDVPDSDRPLVAYIDFGIAQSPHNQSFYINWPVDGILELKLP